MRILHVIPGIAWRYGGTTVTVRSLCSELAQLPGTEIELATTDADGLHGRLPKRDIPQDYAVHVFRRTATEQWKYSPQLGQWLLRNVRRFDLVHIHALWSYASGAAARAAQKADVPYIIRPAGMLSEYTFGYRAWKKRLYWRWLEKATTRRAGAFHATSSAERDDIRRVVPDATVYVIPNGVENSAWLPKAENGVPSGPDQSLGDKRPIVLFMSRLHPKKGLIDLLLPAWPQVNSEAVLAIAGGADAHVPSHEEQVRVTLDKLGLGNRVRLLGQISRERRWELYDAAELFVLPSHSENFGIVVAESMARGCPVVVTDQVQACEHVIAANAGIVVPRSVPALAAALTTMLADADLRKSCGESGRRYARENFCWSQIAASVRDMYEQTVHGSRKLQYA